MAQIQITSTAGKALNLLPNKEGFYFLPQHKAVATGQQIANICAYYEMLIKSKLEQQKDYFNEQIKP